MRRPHWAWQDPREAIGKLEKTQFAHTLGGDAARGDIGHGAGGEIQARVRDVHLVGQDGNANRLDLRNGRIHQREQNIQIVNHHVVHDVYIQAARREHAKAMDFEIKRT